jgi:hypothetical protein
VRSRIEGKERGEQSVAAHETDLWLELARQDSGWTGTDFKRSKSGADMVAAHASRSLDAFAIERPGRYWIFVAILARIVRVRRVTGFWNRPLVCLRPKCLMEAAGRGPSCFCRGLIGRIRGQHKQVSGRAPARDISS